ncbi:MAG: hypothetical protein WC769_13455 [Thermodesulfovibrionales bacterium]|jgi:hypothetical protein
MMTSILGYEWLGGFVSGVVATVIGFGFTALWDVWKMRNDKKAKDDLLKKAIAEDLYFNKAVLLKNHLLLTQELKSLKEKKYIIAPLSYFKLNSMELARINISVEAISGNKLLKLRDISFNAWELNEDIRSRENYRNTNNAMNTYAENMMSFNGIIIDKLVRLGEAIDAYGKEP